MSLITVSTTVRRCEKRFSGIFHSVLRLVVLCGRYWLVVNETRQ